MPEINYCQIVSCSRSKIILEDSQYRLFGVPYYSDVVCGDKVIAEKTKGVLRIKQRLPRSNLLSRKRKGGRIQKIVSNLTHLIIVSDLSRSTNTRLIDHYLTACCALNIQPLLIFNKCDISKDSPENQYILDTYRSFNNYQVLVTSALTEHGISELRSTLKSATAIIVGLSGVGKTSIINRLIPDLNARITDISEITGGGRHTTTEITLYRIPQTLSAIIDSPGIRSYCYPDLTLSDIRALYKEFSDYAGNCSFTNCKHHKEPNCAVVSAVNAGRISQFRYDNYLYFLELQDK